MDGGFYRPRCQDPQRPDPLPSNAYALQRRTAETADPRQELFAWGDFAVIEADLTRKMTDSWRLGADSRLDLLRTRADGRVFRWAEAEASAVLRVIQKAPCARLRGELRTAQGSALVSIHQQQDQLFSGPIGSEWTKFVSRSIEASTGARAHREGGAAKAAARRMLSMRLRFAT